MESLLERASSGISLEEGDSGEGLERVLSEIESGIGESVEGFEISLSGRRFEVGELEVVLSEIESGIGESVEGIEVLLSGRRLEVGDWGEELGEEETMTLSWLFWSDLADRNRVGLMVRFIESDMVEGVREGWTWVVGGDWVTFRSEDWERDDSENTVFHTWWCIDRVFFLANSLEIGHREYALLFNVIKALKKDKTGNKTN